MTKILISRAVFAVIIYVVGPARVSAAIAVLKSRFYALFWGGGVEMQRAINLEAYFAISTQSLD